MFNSCSNDTEPNCGINWRPQKQTVLGGLWILGIALFIIGSLAIADRLTGVVAGGCAVGLSTSMLLFNLAMGKKFKREPRIEDLILGTIVTLATTLIGALAIAGIVPGMAVGATFLGGLALWVAVDCIIELIKGNCPFKFKLDSREHQFQEESFSQ